VLLFQKHRAVGRQRSGAAPNGLDPAIRPSNSQFEQGLAFMVHSTTLRRSSSRLGHPKKLGRRRLSAERLEDRTVMSVTLGSAVTIGNGAANSVSTDVATDAAGNSYVSGMFAGTVDFDLSGALPGDADVLTARGSADAYVAKYAPSGSLIWVRALGGDAATDEISSKLAVGPGGAVYVIGTFGNSADFGAITLTSVGDYGRFLAKIDANGNVPWAQSWGDSGAAASRGVDVDAAGNVYILASRLGDDYEIKKFSASGSAVWTKTIENRSMLTSADIAVNAAGTVYVGGSFDGTVDFDPGPKTKYLSSGSARAGFVLKLDTNGNFGWVSPFIGKTVGSTRSASGAQSIALDPNGNIIVGGTFNGTVDFNPAGGTTYLTTHSGGFITKLNSAGSLVWAKEFEGNAPTFVYGLDTDVAGNIYATGTYHGSVDLDPGVGAYSRTTFGDGDIYAMKLTSAGSFVWAATFGSPTNDVSFAISVDPAGLVHLAGYYRESLDADPDPFDTFGLPGDPTFSRGFLLRLRQT
jgi:hypothetical protein